MQSYNFEPACWSADKNGLDNINECPLGLLSFDGQNAPELNILRGHLVSNPYQQKAGAMLSPSISTGKRSLAIRMTTNTTY